ncbi:nucleotide-sugar transporter-domain-containing protein [Ochromonadaceae sp. CCMP2298]|nr:nucleotide-sugar transporter-domain-containing protein [Ochromonadaceae sp. CCMP2298]
MDTQDVKAKAPKTPKYVNNVDLKWIALLALVFQNAGLAIAMRYTFVVHDGGGGVGGAGAGVGVGGGRYLPSTAVFLSEVIKLSISVVACFMIDAKSSCGAFGKQLHQDLVVNKIDWLKLMIPSALYILQNSLQYFSMSCLSAPVFQVMYQMKIVTTAIFSVLLLGRRIAPIQWVSVVALAIGVSLVQLSQTGVTKQENSIWGLLGVVLGCLTSGFAGVYFELVLKSSSVTIWVRNIQLSFIGVVVSAFSCYLQDSEQILSRGFFSGYDETVCIVVLLAAAGGVKYADNILKGFATSLSILISSLVSLHVFHDLELNPGYIAGCGVVLGAVYMYGQGSSPGGNSQGNWGIGTCFGICGRGKLGTGLTSSESGKLHDEREREELLEKGDVAKV